MKSPKYQPRFYRQWPETKDLTSYQVQVSESDLYIRTCGDLSSKARELLLTCRHHIQSYIKDHPEFLTTLTPYPVEPLAPRIVRDMAQAAEKAGVGPMAAVAGAIAEYMGRELLNYSPEVLVENGGDDFLASRSTRCVGLYIGKNMKPLFIEVFPGETPCGICTSSGTLGHSLSFGKADSVTVIAGTATLADAVATACGNRIQCAGDIEDGLDFGLSIEGVRGVVISIDKKIGLKGNVRLKE